MKQEMMGGSGISWTIWKSLAPHYSIFYRLDALPDAQPTVSKLWSNNTLQ